MCDVDPKPSSSGMTRPLPLPWSPSLMMSHTMAGWSAMHHYGHVAYGNRLGIYLEYT